MNTKDFISQHKHLFKAQQLKKSIKKVLLKKNEQYNSMILKQQKLLECSSMQKIMGLNLRQINAQVKYNNHGLYSQFIPIRQNIKTQNQLTLFFPYFRYLNEKGFLNNLQQNIESITTNINCKKSIEQWKNLIKYFSPHLQINQLLQLYLYILIKDISVVFQKSQQIQCSFDALLFQIIQVKKLCYDQDNPSSMFNVSVEKGQQLKLQTLSKTMKQLFCIICYRYDCSRHIIPSHLQNNNYQYIPPYQIRQKQQNKKNSFIQILKVLSRSNHQQDNKQYCSPQCFKLLSFDYLFHQQKGKSINYIFTNLFKITVAIGIQLFNFQPCSIVKLFNSFATKKIEKGSCKDIFRYLLYQYKIINKCSYKFYQDQYSYLLNETINVVTPKCGNNLQKKKKDNKHKINFNDIKHSCFHYFLNKQPEDQQCISCDCRSRGYCLPSCLCSEFCKIPPKGCKCKNQDQCRDNRCICYKSKKACIPGVCTNCFYQIGKKQNKCKFNREQMKPKKLKIGKSQIEKAGLGLFTVQDIQKGEFVCFYVGQIIQSHNLQKFRQKTGNSNIFYNFRLNSNQNLDAKSFGNKARFINHSHSNANICAEMIKIGVEDVIGFWAIKDIAKYNQLFFNYNGQGQLSQFSDKYPFILA